MTEVTRIMPIERIQEIVDERIRATLKGDGGGGTTGGMSDDWKESVDRQLGQLHGDIRAMLNRGVAAVIGLAALIAGQYVYFNEKFEKVNERLGSVEAKLQAIDAKLDILIERGNDTTKP